MSDFLPAFRFTMQFEDSRGDYAIVPDNKGRVIAGINSVAFPAQFAYIASLSQTKRASAVQSFYECNFWNRWLAQLFSQDLANRVFDAGVNMGAGTAAKLLQECVGAEVDGMLGPVTVSKANECDAETVLNCFRQDRETYYRAIAKNPTNKPYLTAWLTRARA